MRLLVILFCLAIVMAGLSQSALADSQSDHDQCKFVGEIGKADQSIAACDRIIGDSSVAAQNRADALTNRCGWWWSKGDSKRALADCDEAVRISPAHAAAYISRGNAYSNAGDFEHALSDFSEAVRLDPKSAWAYNSRGDLYRSKGDFERALADFNDSIRLDPNYASAYFNRGWVRRSLGDFDQALADLDISIRLDSNNAPAYFNRGSVLYVLGDTARAVDDFTRAIRLDPTYASAYFSRGVAYFVIGLHLADAEADFRKANELNPHDAYSVLWLDLTERRNNVPSQLEQTAKNLDMAAWPAPIIRLFAGELTFAQALAAAAASDQKTMLGQVCETKFYSGELSLLRKTGEAPRLFQQAANECPRGFIELNAAMVELIRKQ
jgi:lipoprotein NlpI